MPTRPDEFSDAFSPAFEPLSPPDEFSRGFSPAFDPVAAPGRVTVLAEAVGTLLATAGFVWVSTAGDPGGDGVRAYDGQVLGEPDVFVRVDQRLPDVEWRALARNRLAHWCLIRATITARATEQARAITQDVIDALERRRPLADGWSCSPIEQINVREPIEDRDVLPGTGRWPVYTLAEFTYTATFSRPV